VLRSSDDNEEAKTKPVSARELVGAAGSGNREKENPLDANEQRFKEWANVIRDTLKSNAKTPAENPSGPPEQFTMRVRTGADVTDVLLVGGAPVQGLPDQDGRWTATNLPTRTRPADKEEAKPAATVPPADPTSSPGRAAKPAVNTSPLVPKPAGSQRTS
jgi:hypothetical protein